MQEERYIITLNQAQAAHDAIAAYEVVYKALGLDEKFIREGHASRIKKQGEKNGKIP